ncbi:MAG TPA: hypothetical protein VLB44_07840, partial [Kofleriaceae bacterium]|nr:hypothetical protein [Kofleriaceae bacterium]
MNRWLVAIALLAACRGDHRSIRKDAGHDVPASVVSAVPKLPQSGDGDAELRALDTQIEHATGKPHVLIPLLLQRATVRGHVEDYQRALAESEAAVKASPRDDTAWKLRINALGAVHRFTDARAALATLATLTDASFLVEPQAAIDDATGDHEHA